MNTNHGFNSPFAQHTLLRSAARAALCAALLLAAPGWLSATEPHPLKGHLPPVASGLAAIDRLPADQRINLAIAFPLRDPAALSALLKEQYDPASPQYHRWLTPEQFTERFGPTAADYDAAAAWAQAHGLNVTVKHPNRMILDLQGSVADIERALHLRLRVYPHPKETRTFYAPDTEPSLDLAVPVLHIGGLDNYARPQPRLKVQPRHDSAEPAPHAGSGPSGTYMARDFRAAYVPGTALTGAGQAVGLLQFDGYAASDIAYYIATNNLPSVTLSNVLLDGFTGLPTGTGGEVEVCLDIQMVLSMAPGISRIYVYEAGPSGVWHDILNRMANDNLAKQLSCSWYIPGGAADAVADQIFQQMASQGQSFYNASGDADAYCGLIDFPGDTPYITQVGGTTLSTLGPGAAWSSERVWNWGGGTGSGGGVSTHYAIPSWQQGLSMTANLGSTTMRNTPDVALTADQVYVRADGIDHNVGGTSAAAPLWAGFTALVNQQAVGNGRPTLGFANPAIYSLGQSGSYAAALHDITLGSNTNSGCGAARFPAVAGYDLATGWGTPKGTPLIDALAGPPDALQISPITGFSATGNLGGPFDVASQNFTLTNSGTASLNWGLGSTSLWLSASAGNGTLAPAATAIVTFSLNAAASNLLAGPYSTIVTFTNLTSGVAQTRTFSLTVLGAPVILAQPGDRFGHTGGSVSFSVSASGATPLSYAWMRNGSALAGATTSTFTAANLQLSDSGSLFSCLISNYLGVTNTRSALLTVTTHPYVAIFAAESNLNWDNDPKTNILATGLFNDADVDVFDLASGSVPTLAQLQQYAAILTWSDGPFVSASGWGNVLADYVDSGGGVVVGAYAWGTSGNGIAGRILNYLPLTQGAVAADTAHLTLVEDLPSHPVLQGVNTFDGATYSRRHTITLTNSSVLVAHWTDGLPLVAVNSPTAGRIVGLNFRPTSTGVNTYGWLAGTDGGLIMANALIWAAQGASAPPSIFTQPANQVACIGGTACFNVNAFGAAPLSYAWQRNGTPIAGASLSSYCLGNAQLSDSGAQFSCLVTNAFGTTLSSNAVLTVAMLPPSITQQPASQTVSVGGTAMFSVLAAGCPPFSYAWQHNCSAIAGATNSIYSANNVQLSDSGSVFSCLVSDPYGSTASSNAVLNVVTTPTDWFTEFFTNASVTNLAFKTFTFSPSPVANRYVACSGAAMAFPTDPTGGTTLSLTDDSYLQITLSGGNTVAIYNRRTNVLFVGSNGYLTMNAGDTALSPSYAAHFSLPRVAALFRDLNPGVGGSVSWKQTADRVAVSYQAVPVFGSSMQTNSFQIELYFDGRISFTYLHLDSPSGLVGLSAGAGQPTNFVASDFTTYGACAPQPPVIVAQPANVSVPAGGPACFSVSVFGTTPLSYAWQRNGVPISGATASSYCTNPVALADSGAQFSCLVSNAFGAVTSSNATLTVLAPTVDHFAWGTIASPQVAGTAFPVSLSALDLYNAVVTGFSGTVPLTGSAAGGLATNRMFNGFTYNSSNSGTYTLGFAFTPTNNLVATHVRSFFGSKVSLWTASGTLLAAQPVAGSPGVWTETSLATPVSLSAGSNYVVAAYVSAGTYYWVTNITGAFPNGNVGASLYATSDAFPTSFTSGYHLLGLRYTVGASSPVPVSPAVSGNFSNGLWSGILTVQQPGSNVVLKAADGGGHAGSSNPFQVVVGPPMIVSQPSGVAVCAGTTACFSVNALGAPPLSYTWQRDGVAIAWATQSSFCRANVQLSDSGAQFSCVLSNSYGTLISSNALLTVVATPPTITQQPANQTVPALTTANFTVIATGCPPLTYAWQRNGMPIAGASLSSYSTNNVQLSDSGSQFACLVSNAFGLVLSSNAVLTVVPGTPPAIASQPSSLTVNLGAIATFFIGASGTAPLTYTWQRNGLPIAGATGVSYTLTNAQLSDSGALFSCLVTNLYGTALSSNATLTVVMPPGPTFLVGNYLYLPIQTNGVFLANSTGGKFNPAGTGGASGVDFWWPGVPVYNYVVGVAGSNYLNGKFQSLTLTNLSSAGLQRAVLDGTVRTGLHFTRDISFATNSKAIRIVDTLQNYGATTLSNVVTFDTTDPDQDSLSYGTSSTLNDVLSIAQPNDLVVASGPSSGLSVGFGSESGFQIPSAVGFNNTNAYAYLTVVDPNGASADIDINLAQNYGPLAPGVGQSVVWYIVFGSSKAEVTNAFALLVATGPPVISLQPANQTVCPGSPACFSAIASGGLPLSYAWQRDGTPIAGATQSSYCLANPQLADSGAQFSCLLSNAYGILLSSNAVLTVAALPPTFVQQPANQTVPAGSTATFSVVAGGCGPFAYSWRRNGVPIPGATLSSYSTNNVQVADSGSQFSCLVSNALGSVTSSNALLIVSQCGGTIVINFDDVPGATLFAQTTRLTNLYQSRGIIFQGPGGLDGGAIVNYAGAWGVSGFSGTNFLGFNTGAIMSDGGIPRGPETLLFSTPVVSLSLLAGSAQAGNVILSAYDAGSNLVSTTNIALSSALRPVEVTGAAIVRAVVSCTASYFVLDDVTFTPACTGLAPAISVQPANQTVPVGRSATFNVTATGTVPLSYAWRRNGAAISGATLSSYTINNVQLPDSGSQFSCLVSNAFGTVLSASATLSVLVLAPDHFAWSTISSPQGVSDPFAVTLTAQDAANGTVTGFSGTALLSASSQGGAVSDNFDRADNASLGSNWTVAAGSWRIETNRARSSPNAAPEVAAFNATSTNWVVSVDVFYVGPGRTTYNALMPGYASLTNCVFVKVQDNNASGNFNSVYFYYGNNGNNSGAWAGMTGGSSYTNVAPFTQARITVRVVGNSVTLEIDRNFDGVPEDVITRGGLPLANLGNGVALGGFANAAFDNFQIGSGGPLALSPTVTGNFVGGVWTGGIAVLQPGSNVVLTANDGAGHYGVSNPFDVLLHRIQITTISRDGSGHVHLTIAGWTGDVYRLLASPDLLTWGTIGTATNVAGSAEFIDTAAPANHRRFYRCVLP